MADNAQTAADVLAAVGGKENVTNLIHCITRLRFSLKDESIPDADAIKKIPGVIGAQWSGGQFQVIIGQNVTKVYDEVMKLGVAGGGSIDIDEGDAKKFEWTPKNVGNAILNYLSKTMVGLIPVMMAAAMFKTIAVIVGPDMLGLVDANSNFYLLFNDWLYDAGFYFMPIYLGYTAAKVLGCSEVLGMMMGGILVTPYMISQFNALAAVTGAIQAAEGALDAEALIAAATPVASTTVFGIPAPVSNYFQTVLPIILCMPVLKLVEDFFKKVIPDMLSTTFVPFLTMLVMVPVGLCALAPLGGWLGGIFGTAMFGFAGVGGFVACAIIAALWEFLVMTGMHQVLIVLAITQLFTVGFDGCVVVAGGIAQWATWGMALGAFLRLREKDEKATQLGYFLSGAVGGVTEPALYGCGFKYTRSLAGMIAGGFVGGAIAGILSVKTYVLGAASVLNVVGFFAGGTFNTIAGVGASVIALVVAAVVTYLFGFTKEQLEEDRKAAEQAA